MSLSPDAQRLQATLERLGCADAADWVESEMSEDLPQAASYRFLYKLWPSLIDSWAAGIDGVPAARRALEAGADRADLVLLARAVAYETVFGLLYHLDDDDPDDDARTLPGWQLTEISPDGSPTGRTIQGLYESLLSLDPSGPEGHDLRS